MPGQPRKAAARKAVPRKAPPVKTDRIDIADVLGITGGDSVPVTFGGVDADIRTSYTGEEALLFAKLLGDNNFSAMFELIAGAPGKALWGKISPLHPAMASKVINAVIAHSGLHEGELVAPLPPSGMTGAPTSPDSATTTS